MRGQVLTLPPAKVRSVSSEEWLYPVFMVSASRMRGRAGLVVGVQRLGVASRQRGAGSGFRAELTTARDTLAGRPGYLEGRIGRNLDDPTLWTLVTRWEHVGAYRRALSAYEVKLHAVPLLSRALEEPSAYEVVEPDSVLNVGSSRVVD